MKQYTNKKVIKKIINSNYSFTDIAPRVFPQLRHGQGMYCMFHPNTHTGTQHARIYFSEEQNIFYLYCYVEGKSYTAYDYVERILCKEQQRFTNPIDFILSRMSKNEFITLYNLYYKDLEGLMMSQFKKKCEYIDNTYTETGNTIDYIEKLYTA